jgi:hypothetical protein
MSVSYRQGELCEVIISPWSYQSMCSKAHPSIGVPVSAASAITAHARPIRIPTSPTCELRSRSSAVKICRDAQSIPKAGPYTGHDTNERTAKEPVENREGNRCPCARARKPYEIEQAREESGAYEHIVGTEFICHKVWQDL